jgi:hypothetical protein
MTIHSDESIFSQMTRRTQVYPFAILDLLADDWVQTRIESARQFGNKPSRIATWWDSLRHREPPDHAPTTEIDLAPPAPGRRAA